jgi:DNA-binding GntR family transcriptional regulator
MEFAKIQRERAVDAVYQAMRQAIVTCVIKPGERLNVEELAEKFGVSLTPVRGAIQQLATEGLIEIRPRSGTFVANLNHREIDETFKIRCALECLAGEDAVHRISPDQIRRLKELLRSLKKKMATDEDRKSHEMDNTEFHQIIIEAAGNRKLQEMYNALNAHIKIVRIHAAESNWPVRLQEEQAEHEAIVGALEAQDAAALAAALRKHIYRAKDSMLAAIKASEQQPAPSVAAR